MQLKPIAAALLLLSGTAFAGYPAMPKADDLQAKLSERNGNPYYVEADYYKRIKFSGFFEASAVYSDHDITGAGFNHMGIPGIAHNTTTDLWLSRANIYVDAAINDWVRFHGAITGFTIQAPFARPAGRMTTTYGYYDPANYNPSPVLTEAYVGIGNLAESNIYARIGRANTRFGDYETNVNPMPLTQALTQTQADIVEVGFLDVSGFNGAIYGMRTAARGASAATTSYINNGGAQIGYSMEEGNRGFCASLDWMADMHGVNYINGVIGPFTAGFFFGSSVNAFSVHAKGHWNQFDAKVQYVTATDAFSPMNLVWGAVGVGAEPEAWMVELGYTFGLFNNDDSRIAVSYQGTDEALGIGLPEERVQADWTVEVLKNTTVGLHVIYDSDYKASDRGGFGGIGAPGAIPGSGNHEFTTLLTLGARFA